jgi:hypothetical protein
MTDPTPKPLAEPKPDLKRVPELSLHSLCEIIPPCTEKEFKELKEDIKTNGLQVLIKVFETRILDGRSRHKACVELEQEGHPVEFKRETFLGSAKDALAYVISMNVKRRHLSASQRALIVARLVTSKLGGDRSVKLPNEITQEQVATLAGVAVKTVTDAKKVLERPELVEKVLNGELAVAKAAKQVREQRHSRLLRLFVTTQVHSITPRSSQIINSAHRWFVCLVDGACLLFAMVRSQLLLLSSFFDPRDHPTGMKRLAQGALSGGVMAFLPPSPCHPGAKIEFIWRVDGMRANSAWMHQPISMPRGAEACFRTMLKRVMKACFIDCASGIAEKHALKGGHARDCAKACLSVGCSLARALALKRKACLISPDGSYLRL